MGSMVWLIDIHGKNVAKPVMNYHQQALLLASHVADVMPCHVKVQVNNKPGMGGARAIDDWVV